MKNRKPHWIKAIISIALASNSFNAYAEEEQTSLAGRFEIVRYAVQGNTLLPEQEINQMLAPYTGKNREFSAVQQAAETLELAYRQHGFSLVKVVLPEQKLQQGVVQLNVTETKIGNVSITGNKFFDDTNIKRSLPALHEGPSPNMNDVSKNVKLANENPQKKTVVQLQSDKQDGVVNAVVQVTDEKPWVAAINVDNTGDQQTGRNRITGAYQHANIAGLDHIFNLQYTTSMSQPADVTILGVGYHVPLYSLGDSVDFYGSYSDVDSGTVTVGGPGGLGFAVSGNGTVFGTRYNHSFLKKSDYDSTLSAGIDYKAFNNDISFEDIPLGNKITVHPLSVTYAGNLAFVGTTINFSVSGVHNIPGGKHGSSEDFEAARQGSNPNYNLVRYNAVFAHAFPADWQVRFALNGQLTSDALVSGEQFGVGGANSVRGFLERELINDEGRITNLEFYTPNLCSEDLQCRLLSFYDTGYLKRNKALSGEETQQSVGSIGLGLRMSFARNWSAQADWAHVVDGSFDTPKASNRAHFKLMTVF